MTITALTAHCDRPEAWDLCARYMARQTRKPDQWLVLDSSPKSDPKGSDYYHVPERPDMPSKVLFAIENNLIKGDAVVFWENDDWFRSDWIEWCEGGFGRNYEIIGEGNAVYYQCRHRWWSECRNVRHAALVQTAVHRDMLELVANVIKSYASPFFDTRLWALDCNKFLATPQTPAERRVVGIKGMYGRKGYSGEHNAFRPEFSNADPSMAKAFEWMGDDALNYAGFYERTPFIESLR